MAQVPSTFGRLVYFSLLRDQNTGRYNHYGMAQVLGEDEADRILRESHEHTFADWLCFDLEQQKADLALYLSGFGANRRRVLGTWTRLEPYRNLIPASVQPVERRLYLADMAALLELLRNETTVP